MQVFGQHKPAPKAVWGARELFFSKAIWQPARVPKANVRVFPDEGGELEKAVAGEIAGIIRSRREQGKMAVLALPTGNTPLGVYRELVRMHKEEGLDFSNVIIFNLDEYYGISRQHPNSYYRFMRENFVNHVNIKRDNFHIFDPLVPKVAVAAHCWEYERLIRMAGGLDAALLGIGRDGHICINERGSALDSRSRLAELAESTKRAALPDFGERRHVPGEALTMGVGTIMEATRIILMATGEHKARIMKQALEGHVTKEVVASVLQTHPDAVFYLDEAAAAELGESAEPYLYPGFEWEKESALKAVCSLSERTGKPISGLKARDFHKNSMGGLLRERGIGEIREKAIGAIKGKIVLAHQLPKNKRITAFSPHPDDDIISMGGTLRMLVENGNEVRVIYMTPGYTAVFDHAVRNFVNSVRMFGGEFGLGGNGEAVLEKALGFLAKKEKQRFGLPDSPEVLAIKRLIREIEAISCCEFVGVKGYSFLNLPFYQTGVARKLPVGEADVGVVLGELVKSKPDIVFAAGDLTDPNGTHRQCLSAIRQALDAYHEKAPQLWLYSGAWSEYHPSEANMLVPLTPEQVLLKREGIFRHESQKDRAPQPGHMTGEFWQMAEMRNAATAKLVSGYGIGEYAAMEAFKVEG